MMTRSGRRWWPWRSPRCRLASCCTCMHRRHDARPRGLGLLAAERIQPAASWASWGARSGCARLAATCCFRTSHYLSRAGGVAGCQTQCAGNVARPACRRMAGRHTPTQRPPSCPTPCISLCGAACAFPSPSREHAMVGKVQGQHGYRGIIEAPGDHPAWLCV